MTGLARQFAAKDAARERVVNHAATQRPAVPPAMPAKAAPEEPVLAQEVTFAEVFQEMQSLLPPPQPADELPSWAKLNIQNAPPVIAKLLGMKT